MNTDLMQGIYTRTAGVGGKVGDLVNLLLQGARKLIGSFRLDYDPLKRVAEFDPKAHVLDVNVPEGKYQGKVSLKLGIIPLATWTQGIHIQ